ncbi:ABC transporter ATP-binding protein [Panacibacter ginsenosidivorans]|uniref:ABC transporter ATP-binding protein n=1 Tax=Panacibacter ginsenosidivorans TaxID=1813871 RepID=A0A5B8VE50_9BACT|nr:ABC transporter ATP-binding protein [Panacibacter ginsenosidivorans]QEC69754.1 ABC transporter ATP-binding protein [Panacibacter ginsenosidivorans]
MARFKSAATKGPGIFSILKPYNGMVFLLISFTLLSNGINLMLPKIIANGIDAWPKNYVLQKILIEFFGASLIIFIFTYLQGVVQVYTSEKVARDLRSQLSYKISTQSYAYIEESNPAKLLTNLTADVDSIKMFVSQAIVSIVSSVIIIIGACIMLFSINWKLAFAIVAIIPIIGGAFFFVLKKVRAIFLQSRQVVDRLNKVINESILGAAIIRVINSQQLEYDKFLAANTKAKDLGLSILKLFAGLIPVIIFTSNLAGLAILTIGGKFVISGSMSLGDYAAFSSYLSLLIFPILVIGFMSNVIAQASASYQRIKAVIDVPEVPDKGTNRAYLKGNIELRDVSVFYGQKPALQHISFSVRGGSTLAVIGPTAAGKTQLLHLLTGLIKPTEGSITFDGVNLQDYNKENFYSQVGFVFQDSILFNMSIRENIAFSNTVTDESLAKAIATAELKEFIDSLPDKLDSVISERGTSLSGGQKQRMMLARALAINPKILLLDDFTARVDTNTETKILKNLRQNYPDITLVSVTQKIATAENFDQIIVLMEGEIVATGIHSELMKQSPEYIQIFNSQQSTSNYELQPQ